MKILHIITNTELGGAQRVCIDLAISALKDGNTVAVASMESGYLWGALLSEIIKFPLKNMVKPISLKKDLKCFFELKKVIKQFKPNIIHLHSSKAGVMGRLASIFNNKRIVYTVHGFDSIRLKHRIFLPLEKILQYFCGAIVPVSIYDEKNLCSEKITKKLYVVHNGIKEPEKKNHLDLIKSVSNRKIIMTIARISPPQKKIQMFLDVAKSMPEYLFIWIGGEFDCPIDETRKKYVLPSNCILVGNIPEASSYLNDCDLFVLFSNFEGLPMTIIEAMANKKPVVASDVGGINELIDENCGKLIETEEDAIKSIKEILENSNTAAEMGNSAYEKYKKDFTIDAMWNKYKSIYKKLIKN